MAVRSPERTIETPQWMTTLTDITMLLMVFFISFFSLALIREKERVRGPERPAADAKGGGTPQVRDLQAGLAGGIVAPSAGEKRAGEGGVRAEQGPPRDGTRYSEGTVVTIAGESAPFAEGSFALTDDHRRAVADLRRLLKGRTNVVILRGHTAGNPEDAVVVEEGRIRPTRPSERGDAWLLSALRAGALREELMRGEDGVPERRIRIRAEGSARPVADVADRKRRALNRRVEILLDSEIVAE